MDQNRLKEMTEMCTGPPRGQGYKDGAETKRLLSVARQTRDSWDWKQALRARKADHSAWKETQLNKASQGTGNVFANAERKGTRVGNAFLRNTWRGTSRTWCCTNTVTTQLSSIRRRLCLPEAEPPPPSSEDITMPELEEAVNKLKPRKSGSHDGVSTELIRAIKDTENGKQVTQWLSSLP